MVCVGRKAQVLARNGMDIWGGKPSFQARAFNLVLTKVPNPSPQPRTAQRVHLLIPAAVLGVILAVLDAPVVSEEPEQFLGAALA